MCSITKAASATGVIDRFADEYARGPHAGAVLAVQPGGQVHRPDRLRARAGRRLPRHRPLCAARGQRRRGVELHKGADPAATRAISSTARPREQLDFLRFPLGDLPKPEVRRLAAEAGLEVAAKPDSQDICFVPDGDYAGLVKRLRPETAAPGEIVDLDGRVLGAASRAWSISPSASGAGSRSAARPSRSMSCASSPSTRRLVVGPRRALAVEAMRVEESNWIGEEQTRGRASRCARWRRRCRRDDRGRLGAASTRPNMASRRARRRCSTTGRGCSAAAGSPRRRRRRLTTRRSCRHAGRSSRNRVEQQPDGRQRGQRRPGLEVGLRRGPGAEPDSERAEQPVPAVSGGACRELAAERRSSPHRRSSAPAC